MRHHLLPLGLAVFLFASFQSQVQAHGTDAGAMHKAAAPAVVTRIFDEAEALKISQGAMGKQLGDYTFRDRSGRKVRLSDYRGKPLIISLIFTSCPHVCPTTTRNLSNAVKVAQDALGADSFNVLTIGFDAAHDTPEAMANFAQRMNVNLPNWEFLSADAATMEKLSKDMGFIYFPSAEGGFSHLTQTTLVDGEGKVYLQLYGEEFDLALLTQPLKQLIYNIQGKVPGFAGLSNKVRLFCTVYNPKTKTYNRDYSFFVGMGVSILLNLLIVVWLVREYRRSPRRNYSAHD